MKLYDWSALRIMHLNFILLNTFLYIYIYIFHQLNKDLLVLPACSKINSTRL